MELLIRVEPELYLLDHSVAPQLPRQSAETATEIAIRRGVLEYTIVPVMLTEIGTRIDDLCFSRRTGARARSRPEHRLVPLTRDQLSSRGSPYTPTGRWEKVAGHPLDTRVRAHTAVDRSIAPDTFYEFLKGIIQSPPFDSLVLTYNNQPVSAKTPAD